MMHWKMKKRTYDIRIPKLEKSIFQLNEQEAADYFAWFLAQIPERVAYVSQVCAKELHIPVEKMDCSPESLLLLWKWFRRRARTEKYSPEEGENAPDPRYLPSRKLTLETEYILRDIGMYLGETFRKQNPAIVWSYYTKPRRDFFVNHPLLKGFVDRTFDTPFEACFEPIHMVRVQASKLLNHQSTNADLWNLYQIWAEKK